MSNSVVFKSEDDFRRMARAVVAQEVMARQSGSPGTITGSGAGATNAHFRCTADFDENAQGWPGVITFRNFASTGPSDIWVDSIPAWAEEINDSDLTIGKRYDCRITGPKAWTTADDEDVESIFVEVEVGGAEAGSFWVEITGGSDAAGYSGKRKRRSAGNTWADSTTPDPLTWTNKIWRAPSAIATSLPAINVGQVVRCWKSPLDPTHLETEGVGGRQSVDGSIGPFLSDVDVTVASASGSCVGTDISISITLTITKTYSTQDVTIISRDLAMTIPAPEEV